MRGNFMPKKNVVKTETSKQDIQEAVDIVGAFLDGRYKSMYLMDAWVKIREILENIE